MKLILTYSPMKFHQWKPDRRILERLKGTGFEKLHQPKCFKVCISLIRKMVECYDVGHYAFQIRNDVYLHLGLLDVLYITGLPINGRPVIGLDTCPLEICIKFLKKNLLKPYKSNRKERSSGNIKLEDLLRCFSKVPPQLEGEDLDVYVRAYVLFAIGCFVAPQTSKGLVSVAYLPLLANINEINSYAWGAALLANLHSGIQKVKARQAEGGKNVYINGNFAVLQIFALEYMPILRAAIFQGSSPVEFKFPLIEPWTSVLSHPSRNSRDTFERDRKIEELFNEIGEEKVVWEPYSGRADGYVFPSYLKDQFKMAYSETIVLCFNEVGWHHPSISPMQLGVSMDESQLKIYKLHRETKSGAKGKDWTKKKHFVDYLKRWEERLQNLFIEDFSIPKVEQEIDETTCEGETSHIVLKSDQSAGVGQPSNLSSPISQLNQGEEGELKGFREGTGRSPGQNDVEGEHESSEMQLLQGLGGQLCSLNLVEEGKHANEEEDGSCGREHFVEGGLHDEEDGSAVEAVPPPGSVTTATINSPASISEETPTPELKFPIQWPLDGKFTVDWIQNLMACFDWSSRNLPPSEFSSILPVDVVESLILVASKMLHKEPNCVTINPLGAADCDASMVVVVGDIHGQLHDFLFLLRDAGYPANNRIFVFNGDYVDRGSWGLEIFMILLAWKVFLPNNVYLLRGNHESKYCTSTYGFKGEVLKKYGEKGEHVYRQCLGCFGSLPLASVIAGSVYTAHGGLFRSIITIPSKRSKGRKNRKRILNQDGKSLSLGSLEELSKVRRAVLDPPWKGLNLIPGDVLWSDPSRTPGLTINEERGLGLLWGPDCTEEFLKRHQLKLIIRSHEGPDARYGRDDFDGMDKGYTIDHIVESGKMITVFSAPDYPQFQATDERFNNKGAYVVLEPPNFDNPIFHSFDAVRPRPEGKAYYDYVDVVDSDTELDFAAMEIA